MEIWPDPRRPECSYGTRAIYGLRPRASVRVIPGEQAAVEKLLGSDGRVLIRPSGTEPLVRVMVEARSADMASNCAERLAEVVRAS